MQESRCAMCAKTRNCVNGRYCPVIGSYVEYQGRDRCDHFQQEEAATNGREINNDKL